MRGFAHEQNLSVIVPGAPACSIGLISNSLDSINPGAFVFILDHHKYAWRTGLYKKYYYFGAIMLSKVPQVFWVSQC